MAYMCGPVPDYPTTGLCNEGREGCGGCSGLPPPPLDYLCKYRNFDVL